MHVGGHILIKVLIAVWGLDVLDRGEGELKWELWEGRREGGVSCSGDGDGDGDSAMVTELWSQRSAGDQNVDSCLPGGCDLLFEDLCCSALAHFTSALCHRYDLSNADGTLPLSSNLSSLLRKNKKWVSCYCLPANTIMLAPRLFQKHVRSSLG